MRNRTWLNAAILVLCLALVSGTTYWFAQTTPAAPVATIKAPGNALPAPDFSFTDLDGKQHFLSDYSGRIVILNVWASWCVPCFVEFPVLLDVAAQRQDVVLIALSIDKNPDDAKQFLKRFNPETQDQIKSPSVILGLDTGQKISRDLFQVFKIPETILIDTQQKQRAKLVGADFDRRSLAQMLDELK